MAITLLFFVFFVTIPSSFSLSFNLSTIGPNEARFINCSGNASISSNVIQVTPNESQNFTAGRATYLNPLHLWDWASRNLTDFTTYFSFVIDSRGSNRYADGLTFFLAPVGSTIETSAYGSNLGIGNSHQFVAVEFDTHRNIAIDPNATEHHVGIDINSMVSVNTTPWVINVSGGSQNDARITYNASSMMLRVDFKSFWNNTRSTGSLSYVVDLREILPEYVIFGFSAATGNRVETHNIISWQFSSNLDINTMISGSRSEDQTGLIVGLIVARKAVVIRVLFILISTVAVLGR